MPKLKSEPLLTDFQKYVSELEVERGFADQSARDKCLLLGEEIGELFKAIRKSTGLKIDRNSKFSDISHELADIFIYVCSIANRFDVDLESAFREKEQLNHQRQWIKGNENPS